MKIVDAKKRVTHLRTTAVIIIATSALFLLAGCLKFVYFTLYRTRSERAVVQEASRSFVYWYSSSCAVAVVEPQGRVGQIRL